ncbi:hypothetical protein BLS_004751 [Venturia inaequalis]|uniref:Uncharacterized protein n=1 Tax=Venturia inaequalis TaxID=5025 RepID=A0A8H3ZGP7_VENIN|nr:hypothetical protein BLS_004751 [Venturia inaequalis]KAE9992712.1 hypothetical protein EG327_008142 [Venturia inaequalis]RDI77916.1 hypothetical protein Vi05172_g12085 [Venturia inaequalis]
MLNSKKLTELLTENVHPKLFPKWIVMSPNATLLAYTGPSDIKELRDQAALISLLWREAEQQNKQKIPKPTDLSSSGGLSPGQLETLTVESESSNIIVRAIQPRLLLVLVGSKPLKHDGSKYFKITPEAVGDARYPSADHTPPPPSETRSSSSSLVANDSGPEDSHRSSDDQDILPKSSESKSATPLPHELRFGLLHIQRNKVDAATEHMRKDFKSKGFYMPEDLSIPHEPAKPGPQIAAHSAVESQEEVNDEMGRRCAIAREVIRQSLERSARDLVKESTRRVLGD